MTYLFSALFCVAGIVTGYYIGGRSGFVQGYDLGYEAAKQTAITGYRQAHAAQLLKEHNGVK